MAANQRSKKVRAAPGREVSIRCRAKEGLYRTALIRTSRFARRRAEVQVWSRRPREVVMIVGRNWEKADRLNLDV